MTARSPMFNFAVARVQWLKSMLETSFMVKGNANHLTASAEKAEDIITQLKLSKLWPGETVELIETLRTADVFTSNDRERIVQYIATRSDMEAEPTASTARTCFTRWERPKHHSKQTMTHIENYLTPIIWGAMERGDHVNYVMERVAKLLVDLGIMYPKEKLFASIVALVEHCHAGPLSPTLELLKEVKVMYNNHRPTYNKRAEVRQGPQDYPIGPSELQTSHAHLYDVAYMGTEPLAIPTWVDEPLLQHRMHGSVSRMTHTKVRGLYLATGRLHVFPIGIHGLGQLISRRSE